MENFSVCLFTRVGIHYKCQGLYSWPVESVSYFDRLKSAFLFFLNDAIACI